MLWGVCCIVFDIDEIFRINFFNISCFLHVLCYFQHLKKNSGGGGGGVEIIIFFLRKTLYHFISRFMLSLTLIFF